MKSQYRIVSAAAIATAAMSLTSASALAGSVGYRAVGDDGLAASPKVRQMLDERARSVAAAHSEHGTSALGYRAVGADGIAASPRLRVALDEQNRSSAVTESTSAVASAGYRATGRDGITASPKLRAQLDERGRERFQIAPVR